VQVVEKLENGGEENGSVRSGGRRGSYLIVVKGVTTTYLLRREGEGRKHKYLQENTTRSFSTSQLKERRELREIYDQGKEVA